MTSAEEELKKFSYQQDLNLIYNSPVRTKINNNPYESSQLEPFDAWQDLTQHPSQSPQKRNKSYKKTFKIKLFNNTPKKYNETFSLLSNKQNKNNLIDLHFFTQSPYQNKQLNQNPQSTRLLKQSPLTLKIMNKKQNNNHLLYTPQVKYKRHEQQNPLHLNLTESLLKKQQIYNTGKRKISRSLKRQNEYLSNNKIPLFLQHQLRKQTNQMQFLPLSSEYNFNNTSKYHQQQQQSYSKYQNTSKLDQSIHQNINKFKIPISTVLYPTLIKKNTHKTHQTIQRFHSFVARTVRK